MHGFLNISHRNYSVVVSDISFGIWWQITIGAIHFSTAFKFSFKKPKIAYAELKRSRTPEKFEKPRLIYLFLLPHYHHWTIISEGKSSLLEITDISMKISKNWYISRQQRVVYPSRGKRIWDFITSLDLSFYPSHLVRCSRSLVSNVCNNKTFANIVLSGFC